MTKRGDIAMTQLADAGGVTLWRRVADDLERAIGDGTFQSGTRLPGEMDIAERFGVNRHTVRRALAVLAERGLIRAARGSGTYVEAQRISYPINARTRFSEIVGGSGREAGGRLVGSAEELADKALAKRLKVKVGAPLIRIDALRHADRVPLCIGSTWFEAERFPDVARIYASMRSMTRTLAHFGIRDYRRASTRVVAALADASDALSLGLAPGRPILVVDSVDVDMAEKPVLTTRARFASERVELVVES